MGAGPPASVRLIIRLQAVLMEPRGPDPVRTLWLHESLFDEAHRLWKIMSGRTLPSTSPSR